MRTLPDPYVLAFLLADAVLLLLFYERLLAALRGGFACLHSTYSTQEMLGNNYLSSSVNGISLLFLPLFSQTLVLVEISRLGFWWTLVVLVGLRLLRELVYLLVGWLSSRRTAFRHIETVSHAIALMVMVAALPTFLLGWLAPSIPVLAGWIWLVATVAAGVVVYVWRASAIILQTRFSSYFWVLYLCGLELLPICVAVNFLMHGN